MATDVVSAVSRFLTPEVMGKLAAASGLDSGMARTAVSAAVPSILSGLASISATLARSAVSILSCKASAAPRQAIV